MRYVFSKSFYIFIKSCNCFHCFETLDLFLCMLASWVSKRNLFFLCCECVHLCCVRCLKTLGIRFQFLEKCRVIPINQKSVIIRYSCEKCIINNFLYIGAHLLGTIWAVKWCYFRVISLMFACVSTWLTERFASR